MPPPMVPECPDPCHALQSHAQAVRAEPQDIVFVPNATTAVNAVLQSTQVHPQLGSRVSNCHSSCYTGLANHAQRLTRL